MLVRIGKQKKTDIMESVVKESSVLHGSYLAQGIVGNDCLPGMPILQYKLMVSPDIQTVNGAVEINLAELPYAHLVVKNVTGNIQSLEIGGTVTKIVVLEGVYTLNYITESFSAYLAIDDTWNGRGGFIYGEQRVENVRVSSL